MMNRDDQPDAKNILRVTVVQLGSRMHYAVPIAFSKIGVLDCLVTDITSGSILKHFIRIVPQSLRSKSLRRLKGRDTGEIPPTSIRQFALFGVIIALLRKCAGMFGGSNELYIWIGRNFARRAARNFPDSTNCIYGFNGASLELFQSHQSRNLVKILEQTMAPRVIEDKLLKESNSVFPGWLGEADSQSSFDRPRLYQRESAEWAEADLIVAGSQFVVDGIIEAGGPPEKCVVIPYAVEAGQFVGRQRTLDVSRPLRVLCVGAVSLRKGAPLVLEAARKLQGKVEFRMVGTINVPNAAQQELRQYVQLTGSIPRSEMRYQFDWADVFLLPSYCEGSATVTYEAMASGLPQIVTPNTGSQIAHGREGLIVPAGSSAAIVSAINRIMCDSIFYENASTSALRTIKSFSIDGYGEKLTKLANEKLVGRLEDRFNDPSD